MDIAELIRRWAPSALLAAIFLFGTGIARAAGSTEPFIPGPPGEQGPIGATGPRGEQGLPGTPAPTVEATGWFLGTGIGRTDPDCESSSQSSSNGYEGDYPVSVSSDGCGDETSWRIYLGKEDVISLADGRFTVGAQLDYSDVGEVGTLEVDAISLMIQPRIHFTPKVAVVASVGQAWVDASQSDWEDIYGLGLEIGLWENWAARAEWRKFDFDSGDELEDISLSISRKLPW